MDKNTRPWTNGKRKYFSGEVMLKYFWSLFVINLLEQEIRSQNLVHMSVIIFIAMGERTCDLGFKSRMLIQRGFREVKFLQYVIVDLILRGGELYPVKFEVVTHAYAYDRRLVKNKSSLRPMCSNFASWDIIFFAKIH